MEALIWEATYMTLAAVMKKNFASSGGRRDRQDKGKFYAKGLTQDLI